MTEDFKLKTDPPAPKAKPSEPAKPAKPKSKAEPKIVLRSEQKVYHHLFKAGVAVCKKNTSYKKDTVQIQTFEHAHFFHSVDSNGRPMTKTNASSGHFHYIEWGTDEDGNLVATCGPAMKEYTLERGGRTYKKEKELSWNGVDQRGEPIIIKDDHKHEMIYLGSEVIQPRSRNVAPSDGLEGARAKVAEAGVEIR